jgi:hypothetical protein
VTRFEGSVIVSASYRTDIPAFYGTWFLNRLRAGWCKVRNPYGGAPYEVSLRAVDVDGFVFWTRNAAPFLDALAEVRGRGTPFVVQYSITGYPREIEERVPPPAQSVDTARRIAGEFGPRVPVWRYDTILDSSLTPWEFHLANFDRLARALRGASDEAVVSFAQIYRKTRRNLDGSAQAFGFTWIDPEVDAKQRLLTQLASCAAAHGMRLTVCSQPELASAGGVDEARCVDAARLSAIAGRDIVARVKGNRPECGCHECRDIGAYDTCPHGCAYCYAVRDRPLALRRYQAHDPAAEFLGAYSH